MESRSFWPSWVYALTLVLAGIILGAGTSPRSCEWSGNQPQQAAKASPGENACQSYDLIIIESVGAYIAKKDGETFFIGLTAFATMALFFYTARLWTSTSKLVEDAKDASARQLRPYVFFDGPSAREWPQPPRIPNRLSVICDVVNGGQTWAHELVVQITLVRLRTGDLRDPFDVATWDQGVSAASTFAPHHRVSLQVGDVPRDEFASILDESLRVFVVGWAKYQDAVTVPNAPRQTRICSRLSLDVEGGLAFSAHPTNNCADEECE